MIWILLFGVFATMVWYKYIKILTYWKDLGVKQTKPWPILGDMWVTILRRISFSDFIQKVYNMYPNERYVGCYQLTQPTLLIRDPELIKQLAVKNFEHFIDHRDLIDPEADPLLGGILFSLKGQRWREMRATLSGAFTSSKMKSIFHLMEEAAQNFVKFFLNKNQDLIEIEMKDTFTRFTNDVIATTAFGIQCDSLTEPNNEFYLMGKDATNFGKLTKVIKIFGFFLLPQIYKLLKINFFSKKVSAYFRGIIKETIQIREQKGIVRPDMLNLLLEARKGIKQGEQEAIETGFAAVTESTYNKKVKQIENLTDEIITAQALIFFLAGFDTVSTAMCFGSYELAVNKDIQDRLREEIGETYEKNNGKITYDVLLKMKYFDMVISEILRIWAPATVTDRICTKPYTIEPVSPNEKPLHLDVGSVVWLPIYAIHRDPTNYPNPEKFDPERFSDENKDSIKPYTYMPFGTGPRNCIGSRFALLEIKALYFNLLLNFEIVPCKRTQIPLKLAKVSYTQPGAEKGFWFALKRIRN